MGSKVKITMNYKPKVLFIPKGQITESFYYIRVSTFFLILGVCFSWMITEEYISYNGYGPKLQKYIDK